MLHRAPEKEKNLEEVWAVLEEEAPGHSLWIDKASCSILQQLGSRLVTVKHYNSYQWDNNNGIIIMGL
jgi:hypothetical protein